MAPLRMPSFHSMGMNVHLVFIYIYNMIYKYYKYIYIYYIFLLRNALVFHANVLYRRRCLRSVPVKRKNSSPIWVRPSWRSSRTEVTKRMIRMLILDIGWFLGCVYLKELEIDAQFCAIGQNTLSSNLSLFPYLEKWMLSLLSWKLSNLLRPQVFASRPDALPEAYQKERSAIKIIFY